MAFRRLLRSGRQLLLLLVGIAVVFFAALNLGPVTVDLFFLQLETSVALLLLVPFLAGTVIGWAGGRLAGRRRRREELQGTTEPAALGERADALEADDWEALDFEQLDA